MKSRKWWLIASLSVLVLIIIVIDELENTAEIEQKQTTQYLPPVSIVNSKPEDNKGVIITTAEIKPRWETSLKAQVSGEVEQVFEKALAGTQVKKGDTLIRIENSRYLADLHEAEQALAEARLNLLQEQSKSSQSQKNWQRAGISKTPSDLVLNIPQLEVAKKTVVAAISRVKAARKTDSYTRVKAPFSGIITQRNVSIGQTVLEGDELLYIVQDGPQDISVALSKKQQSLLTKERGKHTASIRNMDNIEIAQAQIKRSGEFLDPETRQYRLFLEIDDTLGRQTLVGDFVQVHLPSRIIQNSLEIPESALTRNGSIWYLDDEDRLRKSIVTVLLYRNNKIIIETPSSDKFNKHYPSSWRIATTPLASFLAGRRVDPVMVEGE